MPRCGRHVAPGVHRPRRRGEENETATKQSVRDVRKTTGPRRTLRGPGETLNHGLRLLNPELKNQSVLFGAGLIVETFFLVHRIV